MALIFLHTKAGRSKCTKVSLFSLKKETMHMMRATDEVNPAMRIMPQKLLRSMLFEETELVSSGQLGVCPNHAFSN